jgi:hypothetical protein
VTSRRILLFAGLLASCYRYVPTGGSPTPGTHVRLGLHTPTSPELTRVLGAEVTAVEGRVLRASDTDLTLAVSATLRPPLGSASPAPRHTVWAGDHVIIPTAAVSGTELRSLDRKRTTRLATIGAIAAVVAVRIMVSAIGSGGGGDDDDGGGVIPP